jgi:hypothetical protein
MKTKTKRELESDLKKTVKGLFKALGIPWYENVQGPIWGNRRGRPDMEAIKGGVTYYLELKHYKTGKMSAYQKKERDRIEAAGAPYIVVKSIEDVVKAMDLKVITSDG